MTTEPTPRQENKPTSPREAVRMLMAGAYVPLEYEIELLRLIPEAKERLIEFQAQNIPNQVNLISSLAEQEIYVEQIAAALGRTQAAVEDLLDNCVELLSELENAYHGKKLSEIKESRPVAEHIYNWFIRNNGKFFKTVEKKVLLFFRGHTYEIGNNIVFNSMMDRLTKLCAIEQPGKGIWYHMETIGYDRGAPIDKTRWIYTDREKDVVYLNLNSPHHKIIELKPGEVPKVVDNGTNEDGVLLSDSMEIRPFDYQQAADEAEGFRAIKTLLMDTTPCETAQQYFYICWLISTFLIDYQSDRGLLQVIAHTKIGKSKVAERASELIYGVNLVGKGTGAAETRIATNSPMIFQDNLENRDITITVLNFLLFVANSANKPKSKAGSDTEVLYQQLNTLAIITSIEAFPGKHPELVNRTFPVMLEKTYQTHGYMHDEVMRTIAKKRNLILSSILKMISKEVLPRLHERKDWSKHLNTVHPGHNKDRMNEHLCMMLLILEGILIHLPINKKLPIKAQAAELLNHWIAYQEEQAHEVNITANTLLGYLDGLANEVQVKIRGKGDQFAFTVDPVAHESSDIKIEGKVGVFEDPEYLLPFYLSEIQEAASTQETVLLDRVQYLYFIVSSAELQIIFNKYCKNQGVRNQFDGASALGARISNDMDVLSKGDWGTIGGKGKNGQYFKKTSAANLWCFIKTIRRRSY